MSQNKNIGNLIDKLEDLITGLETNQNGYINENNSMVWGKFLSALTQLQDTSNIKNIDVSKIYENINESLASLKNTTEGGIKNTISQIFDAFVGGFKDLDHIIDKDVTSVLQRTTDGLSKSLGATANNVSRQTNHFIKAIGDSFTAIPYKEYEKIATSTTRKKANHSLSDNVFKRTDANISARRHAIQNELSYYKKQSLLTPIEYDDYMRALQDMNLNMSDIEYKKVAGTKKDPFMPLVGNIGETLTARAPHLKSTIKNNVAQNDIGLYDDFYDSTKDVTSALLDQVDGFKELLSGDYVKKRVGQIGGKSDSIKTLDITNKFKDAMGVLEKMGIGTHIEKTIDGLKFGLFDAKKTKNVLSTVNGKVVADWEQMANYTLGIPGDGDGVKINGMEFADQFRTVAMKTPTGNGVGLTTVSQQLLETLFDTIINQSGKPDGLFGKIKNNDYRAASQEIGRSAMDVINGAYGANKYTDAKGASSNAVYRDLPKLAEEIMGDLHAGSTLTQRTFRSNRFNLSEQLRRQFADTFDKDYNEVTGQDLERMMNYIYAHISSPEAVNILKQNKEYQDLFSKGASFLNPTVDVLKKAAPHLGISSLKEANYLFGELAGVDTGVLNPFNPLTSGSYRGVSQGANYVKSATPRDGKQGFFKSAILRSDFMEGLDNDFYNHAEQKVLNMAETSDKAIADTLKSYYQDLADNKNDDMIKKLYSRYVGKKINGQIVSGKGKGQRVDMSQGTTRQDMVDALKNRIMPSVYNGGIIFSDGVANDMQGYQTRRVALSEKDISRLGLKILPDELSPRKSIGDGDIKIGKNGMFLSNGSQLTNSDKFKNIFYENGQYYLDYDKLLSNEEFAKILTQSGGRYTTSKNNFLDKAEFNALTKKMGIENMGIGALVEATKDDPRKLAAQTGETWEALFQQAKMTGKSNETIKKALEDVGLIKSDNTGFFRQSKDGNLYSNFTTKKDMEEMSKTHGISLADLYNTGESSMFHTLAQKLLGNDAAKAFIKNRVHASAVNHANEYAYFEPVGTVSNEEAQARSHVRLTPREVEATTRSVGMLRQLSNNGDGVSAYTDVMDQYMSISNEDYNKANKLYENLNMAYKMSTSESYLGKHKDIETFNFGKKGDGQFDTLLNKKTYQSGGTLEADDYYNTFLGRLSKEGKMVGQLDLGKTITLGDGVKVDKLYIPNLGDRKLSDGSFSPYGRIESALGNVAKGLSEGVSDDVMAKRIGDYYAALQNEMYGAEGTVKSIINGKKLTNAGALKATAGQLENVKDLGENTVVVNDKYLKKILATGKGGDQTKNIGNLETLYRMMQGEADGKEYTADDFKTNVLSKLNNKNADNYEKALINKIVSLTSAENGSVGLQSLFHRYPFTQGLDSKNIKIRTSHNVGYGQFMASKGLAEQINLDYDGDVGYLKNPYLSANNPEQLESAYKAGKELSAVNEFVTEQLARFQEPSKTANDHDRDNFKKTMNQLIGTEGGLRDYVTSVLAKGNFQHVGRLSNFAEYVRDGLSKNALDETGGNVMLSARSTIMRSLFEQLEQDAISSKKISQRLYELTGGDSSKVSPEMLEHVVNEQLSSVRGIMDSMNVWARSTNRTASESFMKDLKDKGILNFESGNRTTREAQARIEKMLQIEGQKQGKTGSELETWYEDQLTTLGLWESRMTNYKGENITNNAKAGIFDMDTYSKNLQLLKDEAPDLYKEGMNFAYARKGSYFIDSDKAIDQVVKHAGGYTSTAGQNAKDLAMSSDIGKTNLYLERLVEVIEHLASASQGASKGLDAINNSFAKTSLNSMQANRAMISGVKAFNVGGMSLYSLDAKQNAGYGQTNHLYDINGNQDIHQDYSVTELGRKLLGATDVDSANGLAIKEAIESRQAQLIKAKASALDTNNILSDTLNYEDFGYDSKDAMLRDSKLTISNQFGTLQHASTEYSNKISEMISGISGKFKQGSKTRNAIENFLSGNVGYEDILNLEGVADKISDKGLTYNGNDIGAEIKSMAGKLRGLRESYKNTLGWLGVDSSYIDEDLASIDAATKNIYKWSHESGRKVVGSEQAMGMRVEDKTTGKGFNLAGAVDSMVYDEATKELTFLDNKNTGNITAGNVFQQLVYQLMGESLQSNIKDQLDTWKKGPTAAQYLDKSGNITQEGYKYLASGESGIDFQWAKGNENLIKGLYEGVIKTAFAHNTDGGYTKIQDVLGPNAFIIESIQKWLTTGEGLSEDDIKALKYAASTIAREGGFLGDGSSKRFSWMPVSKKEQEKQTATKEKQQKAAMKSSLASQKAYDNAELNMLRAQKALERARESGNAEAIYGAEQQLAGVRSQAEIASQYKTQFGAVDTKGNVIKTTDANGRPLSLQQLQQSGVDINNMRGVTRVWDAELGDWKNVELSAAQTKQHITDMSMQWAKQQQAIGKVGTQVKTVGSLVGEVLGGMKQTIQYLMRTSIVYAAIGKVKQAFATLIQTTQALNKSYVDLRIASGQTDSQMKDSLKIYNQMAKEMGKTTQEVANAANDWLRAGYNAEESAKLIKNSMQLSTVGMIDSAKATEYLISTMKGWKLGVDDMEGVVDKLAEIDRHAAISSGDLAESMSRANVSAQLAGSSLNKYMSYLTTVSDVSQLAPESVGTA